MIPLLSYLHPLTISLFTQKTQVSTQSHQHMRWAHVERPVGKSDGASRRLSLRRNSPNSSRKERSNVTLKVSWLNNVQFANDPVCCNAIGNWIVTTYPLPIMQVCEVKRSINSSPARILPPCDGGRNYQCRFHAATVLRTLKIHGKKTG